MELFAVNLSYYAIHESFFIPLSYCTDVLVLKDSVDDANPIAYALAPWLKVGFGTPNGVTEAAGGRSLARTHQGAKARVVPSSHAISGAAEP